MQVEVSDSVRIVPVQDSAVALIGEPHAVSLFKEHELQVQDGLAYLERFDPDRGFAFAVLFICAAIAIYLQRSSDGIFPSVFKASFDRNQALQDAREENSQRTRNLFILQLLGLISIALFTAGGLTTVFHLQMGLQTLFLIALGGLISFVLLKKAALWLLALIYELRTDVKVYGFNVNILRSVAGLLLLPLTLLMFYSPIIPGHMVFHIGLVVGLFFYLKGLQRGLSLAINTNSVSALHLFYYLCALEILPVFVLIRIAQSLQ